MEHLKMHLHLVLEVLDEHIFPWSNPSPSLPMTSLIFPRCSTIFSGLITWIHKAHICSNLVMPCVLINYSCHSEYPHIIAVCRMLEVLQWQWSYCYIFCTSADLVWCLNLMKFQTASSACACPNGRTHRECCALASLKLVKPFLNTVFYWSRATTWQGDINACHTPRGTSAGLLISHAYLYTHTSTELQTHMMSGILGLL
jgi:hypothetical protein